MHTLHQPSLYNHRHLIHSISDPSFTSVSWLLAILQRNSSEWEKCLFKFTTKDASEKISPFYCWCTSFFLMGMRTSEQERKFFFPFHPGQHFILYSFQHVCVCICMALCMCDLCKCVCWFPAASFPPPLCLLARSRSITIFFLGKSILHMISPLPLLRSAQP